MMTSAFFKRVMFQFKQPWIFFTLESLNVFDIFLKRSKSNNPLMQGITTTKALTPFDRKVEMSENMV